MIDAHVRATLARGGIVVYPTETLYGLGACALSRSAVARVADLKGRADGKPIAVIVSDVEMMTQVVTRVPPPAEGLIERFWPGPLTLVLPARADLPPELTAGSGVIGVRVSSHPIARALSAVVGEPITATSANVERRAAGMRRRVGAARVRGACRRVRGRRHSRWRAWLHRGTRRRRFGARAARWSDLDRGAPGRARHDTASHLLNDDTRGDAQTVLWIPLRSGEGRRPRRRGGASVRRDRRRRRRRRSTRAVRTTSCA